MQGLKHWIKRLQERQFALTGILVVMLMLSAHFPRQQVVTLRMGADDFNIPYRQSTILLDGKIAESAWRQGGMIQLGAAQKPIKVYSLHDRNFLYLGFHITDLLMVPGKDCIRIVLNPYLGSHLIGDSLFLRFDILLFSDRTRNFMSTWDQNQKVWYQSRGPAVMPIWSEIYRDLLLNYCQVEIKIDRNQLDMQSLNSDKLGLYLQILDFSTDTDYCGYDWPARNQVNMEHLNELPLQSQWARARLNPDPSRWNWFVDLIQVSD